MKSDTEKADNLAKTVLKFVIFSQVVLGGILYLLASFIAADFDVTHWSWAGRFALCLFWGICCVITIIIGICFYDDEQKKRGKYN